MTAIDPRRTSADRGMTSPTRRIVAITPDDSNELAEVTRALRICTAGDLHFVDGEGNEHTWPDLEAGYHPIEVRKVFSTNTNADGIYGLY